MIIDGDRVAVAVSGGKDSLSLLTLLRMRQRNAPQRYELVAVNVRGDARGYECPHHPVLAEWLETRGYTFTVVPIDLPKDEPLPLTCQRCTWNRRKTIFRAAERWDCNVVAFAHNADDLAQTTLLNLFFGGRVETMALSSEYFGGRFRLIRPLAFVAEKDVRYFSRACDFPPPPDDCPRAKESQRERMDQVLRMFGKDAHKVRMNLVRAALKHGQIRPRKVEGT
ncbi:MAG: hypothetical protein GTO41_27645 [Burkholderiales bacterium]|nr:hypothetical protein [Burkholderiales bacterium]